MKKPNAASVTTPDSRLDVTPSPASSSLENTNLKETMDQRSQFLVMVAHMTWQLAIVILVPVIAGAELDKALRAKDLWVFIGLGIALLGSVVVIWRTVRAANRLPVPKLSDEQRRAIQKQYEEDDSE